MANKAPEMKKILVPISSAKEDIIAIKQSLIFRKTYNCKIILYHVVNINFFRRLIARRSYIKKLLSKTEKKLEKIANDFFEGKIPDYINLKVTSGNLIKEILKTSKREKCDLIIIKKRERRIGKSGLFKIENADKLIAGAVCPVMTIPKKQTEHNIKTILIPVDITKKIDMKIAWAKLLAEKFHAKIHVVSILNVNIKPVKSLAHRKALLIEESMKKAGIECELNLLKAEKKPMYEVVLTHIDNIKPDLVLMMTHQESILFDDYIGEFATEVIHQSHSPIFSLVPRKDMLVTDFIENFSSKIEH